MTTLTTSAVTLHPRLRSPKVLKAIITMIEAFHEALDMRRDAHRRRPFIDE